MTSEYPDNYHDKFNPVYTRMFTGRIFTPKVFLRHLTNINAHFECGQISRLSDEGINKIKLRFSFFWYGFKIRSFAEKTDDSYHDDFIALVEAHGKKYGFGDPERYWEV